MRRFTGMAIAGLIILAWSAGCERVEESAGPVKAADTTGAMAGAGPAKPLVIGVAFDTLQTEYWVASIHTIEAALKRHDARMLQAIAYGDVTKQHEQVRNFIAQKVDGIIIAPNNKKTVVRMIKDCNEAGIPVVLYNRPPEESDAQSVTVVADNYEITKDTVTFMCEQARKSGRTYKAMILVGDLGDENAIGRRDGFEDAVKPFADIVTVVARVPTEWDQGKAMNGVTNAFSKDPDINFIFSCSDFLLPSVISALEKENRYKKIGEEGHVILGGFDGDATAYRMLKEGYLDADGVQDMTFESEQAVQAILDLKAGKEVAPRIFDKGFVIHQGNLDQAAARMWGAQIAPQGAP